MAVVVVCSTVCASAPIKLLVICTVGGVISGYWLIGMFRIASPPTSRITIEITIAVTGLFKNIFELCILLFFLLFLFCRRRFRRRHIYRDAIPKLLHSFYNHLLTLRQTVFDNDHPTDAGAEGNL